MALATKKPETVKVLHIETRYTTLLEGKGSYIREFDDDNIPKDMEDFC